MTRDEFLDDVAAVVAGLQVMVSITGRPAVLGAAAEPWQRLLHESNKGFGWTDKAKCREAFSEIVKGQAPPVYLIDGNLDDKGWVNYGTLGHRTEDQAREIYASWQASRDVSDMPIRYRLVKRVVEDTIVLTEEP